jgi:hypothetical protein
MTKRKSVGVRSMRRVVIEKPVLRLLFDTSVLEQITILGLCIV